MPAKPVNGLTPADFVHLHNHTHHSLLDGLQKVPAMIQRVKDLGMEAVAMTDHGTLSGAIEFYKEAKNNGVKPLIGMEAYVAARSHTDKDPTKDKARYHLIIIAMNNTGYENLMRLSTIANLEGFYFKPRISRELLQKYHEGLIILSGCIGGEVGDALRSGQYEQAKAHAQWYKDLFGDRYYLELQDHGHQWDEQKKVNDQLIKLGRELDIPLVVTSDAHYLTHEDQEAHEVLLCVQTGSFLEDEDRMSLKETDLYLADPKEIIERWKDVPGAVSNTRAIADRCDVSIELGKILIPEFPVPEGMTEKSYLHTLVYQGLAWRYGGKTEEEARGLTIDEAKALLTDEILERTQFELDVIGKMGFDGYFLIVQDFIVWGKNQGIVFGPGRGSAAGSIVAFALKITDLDPIKYDLLFERFLNPDRISMPDIDIDIQDTRRDEVIRYCVEKYGEDRVANIVTFGTMAGRAATRDVARVLQVPYNEADRLAKLVPPPVQGRHIPLTKSVVENPELKEEYDSNPVSKRVLDLAMKLEGTNRSHGVHAAGVVIAPDDLVKFVPLEMAQKGVVSTQYPMNPVEEIGLLKMDFLGLSNLTIIKNALRIIKKVYGEDIDIGQIPLDDQKTFELLGRGDTTGVFQLESGGMKRYIKQLQPTRFEDIVAMVALYRPGPMQFIDDFIARKHGKKKIEYLHPKMEASLENTYGVLVYQEQVMQIAKEMCGFTGGQADTLRKAIGKKIVELMAKMKEDFIEGGIKNSGADRAMLETFWKQLEEFAAYCFNKSHAACYALVAYQTAYLKAHYPDAFMAALMTSDQDDTDRLAIEITECRHMDIQVLQPDVNQSYMEFGIVGGERKIRFGMAAIKNVGGGAVEEILRARESGPFESIEDFATRVSVRSVNRKAYESLIKAGAFDSLGDRATLLFNLDTIISFANKVQKEAASGQVDLFGEAAETASVKASITLETPTVRPSEREQLQWERDLLGLYLSSHPLEGYDAMLDDLTVPIGTLTTKMDKKEVTVGGVITTVRAITTKKGSRMAFVGLEDRTGELEMIVFPELWAEHGELMQSDTVIMAKGTINTKDRDGRDTEEIKLLADTIIFISLEEARSYQPTGTERPKAPAANGRQSAIQAVSRLYLHVREPGDDATLQRVRSILTEHPGKDEAILVLGTESRSAIKLPFKVAANSDLATALHSVLSPDCVAIR